jgi:DNA primase
MAEQYLKLRQVGKKYWARCPFHKENTASFKVENERYYCFGCSAKGDVITFLMRIEGVRYPEALKILAERAGIPVEGESNVNYKAWHREAEFLKWWWARYGSRILWSREDWERDRDILYERRVFLRYATEEHWDAFQRERHRANWWERACGSLPALLS